MVCLRLLSSYSAVQTLSNLNSNRKKCSFWSNALHITVVFFFVIRLLYLPFSCFWNSFHWCCLAATGGDALEHHKGTLCHYATYG